MNPFIIPPSKTVTAVGMGVFDGIHRGHRHVLEDCDTLLTFDPHPQKFFNPTCDLQYLTPLDERQSLFDHVVALRFDDYLAHLDPLDFLNLIKCITALGKKNLVFRRPIVSLVLLPLEVFCLKKCEKTFF